MTYTVQKQIKTFNSKRVIETFAYDHLCKVKIKTGDVFHECTFTSRNINAIEELADQLDIPYSEIKSK